MLRNILASLFYFSSLIPSNIKFRLWKVYIDSNIKTSASYLPLSFHFSVSLLHCVQNKRGTTLEEEDMAWKVIENAWPFLHVRRKRVQRAGCQKGTEWVGHSAEHSPLYARNWKARDSPFKSTRILRQNHCIVHDDRSQDLQASLLTFRYTHPFL